MVNLAAPRLSDAAAGDDPRPRLPLTCVRSLPWARIWAAGADSCGLDLTKGYFNGPERRWRVARSLSIRAGPVRIGDKKPT
jgi:hypothetical protein